MNKDEYIKIAKEYETKGRRVLAKELGITESRLSVIVKRMIAEGVQIRLKRDEHREAFKEAIAQIKSEQEPIIEG